MNYRREIDGLRALAVVPVILFHAGFQAFEGGYVGVDVFFVISGYLITSILLAEVTEGDFTIRRFYERRARRILPALFVVMAAVFIAGLVLLLPKDLKEVSRGLAAVSLFSSNVLFWKETHYFGTASEMNPLLHTWSLGVEEQFYVFFPVFLLLARNMPRRRLMMLLAGALFVSLALAQWATGAKPKAAFFLLPPRAWELLTGAMLAFGVVDGLRDRINSAWRNMLAALGLGLVGFSVAYYTDATPFPGIAAVAPVLGAALLITAATPDTVVGRILGTRLFVGIGLLSYSAYLWHQPLLAFARRLSRYEPAPTVTLALCLATFALAWLSWRFVERPFRKSSSVSTRGVVAFSVAGSALFLAVGVAGQLTGGYQDVYFARLDTRGRALVASFTDNSPHGAECKFLAAKPDKNFVRRFDRCHLAHGQAVVVLGDSHAMDLYSALAANTSRPFVVGVAAGGCRPAKPSADCQYEAFLPFAQANRSRIEKVIYTQSGMYLLRDDEGSEVDRTMFRQGDSPTFEKDEARINDTVAYLARLSKLVPVVWLGPRAEPHVNSRELVQLALRCDLGKVEVRPAVTQSFLHLDEWLARRVALEPRIQYVSEIQSLGFDDQEDLYDCSRVYWSDTDHWSVDGERRFGARLAKSLALR